MLILFPGNHKKKLFYLVVIVDLWNNMRIPVKFIHALLRGMYFYFRLDIKCLNVAISCFPWQDHAVILEKLMIHEGLWEKKESFNLLHRHPVKKTHTHEVFIFLCILWILCLCVRMNHNSILCGFWPQSEVFPPRARKACICEDWVGIFIFLKHLLFCSAWSHRGPQCWYF